MPPPDKLNIVLSWFMNDWGEFGRTYEKVAITLSQHERIGHVLVVLPPVRHPQKISAPFSIQKISKKLSVCTPSVKVIDGSGSFYRFRTWANETLPGIVFKNTLKKLGYNKANTMLWLFPPSRYIETLLESVPHAYKVTQIVDNNTFHSDMSEKEVAVIDAQYKRLASISDTVITSSDLNFDFFKDLNSNTFKFINAVDSQFIGIASELPHKTNNTRPKLLYVGWISQRTDMALLKYIAQNRPDYDVIIAGPDEGPLEESNIQALDNVTYLGKVAYSTLPELFSSCDICLIPHKDNKYSQSMSPLKLFQYLASGRPVVSTDIGGIDHWKALIHIANSYAQFIEQIDYVLVNDNIELSKTRISEARKETWEIRVNDMLNTILAKHS